MGQMTGLKSLRLEKGWSQEQLAEISGLSERTIQRAERGETPSLETLRALAASFELTSGQLRDLMQSSKENPPMPANDTATPIDTPVDTPAAQTRPDSPGEPLLSLAWKRVLLAGGAYIVLITWFALMQMFFGWDPELLPFIALTGAGVLATVIFTVIGKDKAGAQDGDDEAR
ncbi:helix-turn-helix transcriptional regulator [Maricaulis sp.]|uniref:helix-turn-helix transcriptional regulator n=1 Tax=Maricaulis sp. TaxID=1486257 RepID=UPI002636044B|nr:helix-turn-helix transcriptional regulator [Maricaulis sp.]